MWIDKFIDSKFFLYMIRKFKEGLHGKKNFINKKDLSDAIFFEFEEFFIVFFL